MILNRNDVKALGEKLRRENKKIVFTNGCFDILHLGHVRYLTEARALGDFLFVGINTDASVSALKGLERPVQSESDRAEILSQLKCVDGVSLFGEATPLELISLLRPDVLVKGGDWELEKIVGKKEVESWGGKVRRLPFVAGHSTTQILEKIKKL